MSPCVSLTAAKIKTKKIKTETSKIEDNRFIEKKGEKSDGGFPGVVENVIRIGVESGKNLPLQKVF